MLPATETIRGRQLRIRPQQLRYRQSFIWERVRQRAWKKVHKVMRDIVIEKILTSFTGHGEVSYWDISDERSQMKRECIVEGATKYPRALFQGARCIASYAASLVVVMQGSERMRLGKGNCRGTRQYFSWSSSRQPKKLHNVVTLLTSAGCFKTVHERIHDDDCSSRSNGAHSHKSNPEKPQWQIPRTAYSRRE